ncbi:hypothetical protein PIB30_005052 [Stylosanthes scabra]|uniref:DDE Tnp4 domain-containing protein n=1 Tax=Stylosanthes scabra TaxID=79078 RepID=A0ABU6Z2G8_9FABA|nr:hypothetical protein [Stylosanthes scabra]
MKLLRNLLLIFSYFLLEPLVDCRDPLLLNLTAGSRLRIGLFHLAKGSDYPEISTRFGVPVSVAKFCVKQLHQFPVLDLVSEPERARFRFPRIRGPHWPPPLLRRAALHEVRGCKPPNLRNWDVLGGPIWEEFKVAVAYIGACSILHNGLLMREDFSALASEIEGYQIQQQRYREFCRLDLENVIQLQKKLWLYVAHWL